MSKHTEQNTPKTPEASVDASGGGRAPSVTSYLTPAQWAIYTAVVVVGLLLRWLMLDMRPYHHDESLHGMYGGYFYDFPDSNFYKYDPMLHGPMLYNCMRFIYAMFGDSLWAARTPVCIMGSLFILVPLLYRGYLKPVTTLLLTGYIALSPTMIYWSRFLREDYWVISGMLLSLFGLTIAPQRWRAFLFLFGLTIQWCTKENVFVTVAVVAGFFIFEACFQAFILKERDNYLARIGRFIRANFSLFFVSALTCGIIYAWFYGAGFRHPRGIIEGLGGKAIGYWAAHHNMERIKGPFNFHIYVTAWYELPLFLALITHLILFYRRAIPQVQFVAGLILMTIILSWVATDAKTIESHAIWKQFKLKNHLDIVGLLVLLFHAPLVTIQHLLRRERVLASAGYFFSATFFVYSYLGEKVPWLSVYPLVYSLPYLALFFEDYFKKHPFNYKSCPVPNVLNWIGSASVLLGVIFIAEQWGDSNQRFSRENLSFVIFGAILLSAAFFARVEAASSNSLETFFGTMHLGHWATAITAIFLLRAAVQTNYLYAGKETEYLSQVHTTYELAEYAKHIIDQVVYERNGFRPKVYATGESTWPLTWYFRRIPQEYRFSVKDREELKDFAYIFISWKEKHDPSEIPEGYIQRRINLRGWWVPDFGQVTLKRFLRYSVNHYPWNTSGFSYATMLTAKDMERFRK
jgi:uncharacterized protein (TIGR03663 family)